MKRIAKVGLVLAGAAAAATAVVLGIPAQAAPQPEQLHIGISRVDPGPGGVAVPGASTSDQGPSTVGQERQLANGSTQTYGG